MHCDFTENLEILNAYCNFTETNNQFPITGFRNLQNLFFELNFLGDYRRKIIITFRERLKGVNRNGRDNDIGKSEVRKYMKDRKIEAYAQLLRNDLQEAIKNNKQADREKKELKLTENKGIKDRYTIKEQDFEKFMTENQTESEKLIESDLNKMEKKTNKRYRNNEGSENTENKMIKKGDVKENEEKLLRTNKGLEENESDSENSDMIIDDIKEIADKNGKNWVQSTPEQIKEKANVTSKVIDQS
ncbi:hypothetical protein PV328_012014 [Microctonus aethiopoides]|uniref:Uncharacterized protein n=1 Tax=Microctonus aethiopoides TaxID=144406 RepID=A0AA39C3N7_9HYME|nr:hypothetical protein PV328_012014 [Microctonus aethiopoides]